jgi:ATP-dependent Clp protease ATP-binding subunit ClpB
MFTPLDESEIRQIVGMQLANTQKMLSRNGITLTFTDSALDYLAEKGYDPQFGARPVKRVIQDLVLNELSKRILANDIDHSRPVIIDKDSNGLTFKN